MQGIYNFIIHLYAFAIGCAALFNKKARLRHRGAKNSLAQLQNCTLLNGNKKSIWIHAASLGEFEQGRPFIEKIRKEKPNHIIILSFFSSSGYEVRKGYNGADIVCYLPMDTPRNARKFIEISQPEMVIFIKYEFWANYLFELRRREIPTYIISAIFRPKQMFFKANGAFFVDILRCFTHLFVQNDESKQLLANVGITNVTTAGDTRFDRVADISTSAKSLDFIDKFIGTDNQHIIVAGSTWGPDEILLAKYINTHRGNCKLIIAPHEVNPQRISELCKRLECSYIKWSTLSPNTDTTELSQADCLIIDTIGILSSVYQYGKIAYIGGGFGTGIHNTLEAAAWAMPVMFGTNYHKFQEAKDLIDCNAAFSIASYEKLNTTFNRLLTDSSSEAKAAQQYVQSKIGATNTIIKHILKP